VGTGEEHAESVRGDVRAVGGSAGTEICRGGRSHGSTAASVPCSGSSCMCGSVKDDIAGSEFRECGRGEGEGAGQTPKSQASGAEAGSTMRSLPVTRQLERIRYIHECLAPSNDLPRSMWLRPLSPEVTSGHRHVETSSNRGTWPLRSCKSLKNSVGSNYSFGSGSHSLREHPGRVQARQTPKDRAH
jgi:hypothetical protein